MKSAASVDGRTLTGVYRTRPSVRSQVCWDAPHHESHRRDLRILRLLRIMHLEALSGAEE